MMDWNHGEKAVYVAAHRGWKDRYPENTMLAFRKAVELGVDQIETDIRVTKDGQLVLIHDATVDRTTNGTGKACDFTLEELQELDAGSWMGEEFAGARIPTLREFMDYISTIDDMTVDLELKEYPVPGWEETAYRVCDQVLAMVEEYGFADRCVINSFSGTLLEYVHAKYPGRYRIHAFYPWERMADGARCPGEYAYCACVFGPRGHMGMPTMEHFDGCRAAGLRPWAGAGVRTMEDVEDIIARGGELITCNNPDEILAFLRQKGYHR